MNIWKVEHEMIEQIEADQVPVVTWIHIVSEVSTKFFCLWKKVSKH